MTDPEMYSDEFHDDYKQKMLDKANRTVYHLDDVWLCSDETEWPSKAQAVNWQYKLERSKKRDSI